MAKDVDARVGTGHRHSCSCVCFYLTSGFAWPVRPRDAGPGADHRTGMTFTGRAGELRMPCNDELRSTAKLKRERLPDSKHRLHPVSSYMLTHNMMNIV